MSGTQRQPLQAAIKQALYQAHVRRPRPKANAMALLAMSAAALSPQARGAEYLVANETELRDAIRDANLDGDASSTITLTGNIVLASTAAFDAMTKPITIDTNGFRLDGQSGVIPGGTPGFSNNTVTVVGSGELRGGNTADSSASINLSGGAGLTMTNGSVSNRASITGGNAGHNSVNNGGLGGDGVWVMNGSLTNDGSITGGIGGNKTGGAVGSAGTGGSGVTITNGTLANNGVITGGHGGDQANGVLAGNGAQGGTGATLFGGTNHVNNGTIRGGLPGVRAADGVAHFGGVGAHLSNGAALVNNTGALIEGGATPSTNTSYGLVLGNGSNQLTNHGTIRGGSSAAIVASAAGPGVVASGVGTHTVTNTGTIEGGTRGPGIFTNQLPFQNVGLIVINSGTIRPGAGQSTAIQFGTNAAATSILEVQPGSVIEGNVLAPSTNLSDTFRLGGEGEATFDMSEIGTKYSGFSRLEKTGTSTWTLTGTPTLTFGWSLLGGTLSVSNSNQLTNASININGATLRNTAAFTHTRTAFMGAGGGIWQTDADLIWSGSIQGTNAVLTKTGAATLILSSTFNIYSGGTTISEGTLQFGNGGNASLAAVPTVGDITNNSVLAFNYANALSTARLISGTGSVIQRGTGTTTFTANNTYTGETRVDSGTLRINGDQSAATGLVTVANGATLGGSGVIGGAVNVADGGHIAPGNSPGTLTMGSLTLSGGSVLDFELGEAGAIGGTYNDLINVNGDLTLDGTLNVSLSAGGTYGAGIYRLINYTGTLTDNGLDLGLMPASSANYVQASVANQVNLINTQGLLLNYWDGANDARNNGNIGGGSGLWQAAGNDNWTLADAAINADYQDNAMVIFGGTSGTVTVDDSLGPISVSGMQFASDDYRIEGDAIVLGAGSNTVRVGDGTDAGASFTATVASALTGSGMLDKTDLGTLVLTGDNTYTGGTTISGGTVQLGEGGTSGSLRGDITNNATLVLNRSDTLSLEGVISGTGVIRQLGSGSTVLSGAGSTVGTLEVQRGSLELASAASLSANATMIAAGATLRSAGAFEGTAGDDTLTLGGTLIGAVSLLDGNDQVQITAGADFSQATFDGGAGIDTIELVYDRALTVPESFAATAFEQLTKRGQGELTFSGAVNVFSDSITVAEGNAQLSNANVVTNEFRIEQSVTLSGTGSLSGNLVNAGVLSPGHSPGTIHVGGNYAQSAGGVLISEISHAGTDLLDVDGSASLAGTHRVNVEYGMYLDGTTHALIQADGGISGDFDSIEMNTSALMTAQRELSANALTVSFARQPMTSVVDPQSGRGRFAAWLEEQISAGSLTPTMTDYIDSLLQQPTAEGIQALLGERGEPVASVTQNSVSILGAGFARSVFERFTLSETAQCAPTQPTSSDSLNCFWGQGLRRWGQAGGDSRYDWTNDGLQIGADRQLSSGWSLGGTFGYGDTSVRDLSGAHNEVRSNMGGLYANYNPGRLSVGTMAFYTDNDNETRRSVLVGATRQQARADFDSDSYGAAIRLSYRLTSETGPLVRPFIEAFYDHVDDARFSERNAGDGNLSARIHERDGLRGTLGLQLADNYEGYGQVFRPALELGVAHQFEDARSTLDLQPFSGMSAFRTHGPALDRTAYIARASLNLSLGANASIALGYGGEFADDYSQNEGNLSFRFAW
jgi:autotransporter-associated beta strand protein